jgi:protein O-GlcNAc transferase
MSSNVLLMNKARASHQRGDFQAAARAYESILKLDPRNYDAAYMRAVALYQAGLLERAAEGFAAAARINPRKVEPHKDRGLVMMKLGRHEAALASFEAATRLMPDSPELLLNRGLAQRNCGLAEQAVASYEAALRLRPGFAEAHNNLANSLSLLGRKEEALASYARAYALKPGYGEAYVNAAAVLLELERPAEAREILEKAIAANPRHAEAHRSMAECLRQLGQGEEAIAAATRAVNLDRMSVDCLLTRAGLFEAAGREQDALADYASARALDPRNKDVLLANAELFYRQSRHEEAIALCDAAIIADPEEARSYHLIGKAMEARKELPAAAASYAKAAQLDPAWLSPLLRHASVLDDMGRHDEALAAHDQAIALQPDSVEAHIGKGDTLRGMRRFEEALACFDHAIALAPERHLLYGTRGSLRSEMGQTAEALEDFGQSLRIMAAGNAAAETVARHCISLLSVDKIPAIYATEAELAATRDRVESVLDELLRVYDGEVPLGAEETRVSEQAIRQLNGFYLAYHQRNDQGTMRKLSLAASRLLSLPPWEAAPRTRTGPIRIGIASQRLRNHNGANWAYNWFANLPRGDYEFFTYAFETTTDDLSQKFAALGSHRVLTWSRGNPHEIVRQMRSDGLDMLMLTDVGMTAVSRFLSLHRIAPCQFTAWGHPVTTGSPEMDFYLSSDLMEPEDGQDHYTEKLVRMPNLALYLEERAGEARPPAQAADFGLPEGRVLFGCLQSLFKYLPRHDAILPRIAREVPAALFVFLEGSPPYMTTVMRERLERAFAEHGLDAGRHVMFMPRCKPADFNRLMQAMDICIDSVGWSGGNTSLKNIAQGVPLATLAGDFMRGRHTSAMFTMIGADEMIATSLDAYVDILVRLGREEAYRRHCAALFTEGRHRLYRDAAFIRAFDGFLKENA